MKHFTLLILLLLSFVCTIKATTKAEADTLYAHGEYQKAANIYKSLLENNGAATELYYNLGNCFYKTEDIAHSILYYEKALRLNPADEDIRANLTLVRSKTADKVTPPTEMFFITWWKTITNAQSITTWATIGIISFILFLAALCIYFISRNISLRRISFYSSFAMLTLTIFSNLCAYTQRHMQQIHDEAIIMQPAVSVKSSPSASSTDLFVIHAGSKVLILDTDVEGWNEVHLEEGKQGWIPSDALEEI